MIPKTLVLPLSGIALGLVLGLGMGWKLWKPTPVQEVYAKETRQKDGSLILPKKPQADAKPKHEIPKGVVVERIAQIIVSPNVPTHVPSSPSLESPSATVPLCPPVTVDMTLIRQKDGTRRIVASSPDGQVIGGVDIPVESAAPAKVLKNAAGASYNPVGKTYGLWYQRNIGPAVLGVDAFQQKAPVTGAKSFGVMLRLGIRF